LGNSLVLLRRLLRVKSVNINYSYFYSISLLLDFVEMEMVFSKP
jgi:hypothetical protein